MEICFLITTYHRKEACQRLVNTLKGDIFVLNDGDEYEITGCEYWSNTHNYGKTGYWHTVNSLWQLPKKMYDYYFMIPDDFLPVEGFEQKAIAIWKSIKDEKKICLNLYMDPVPRERCWTNFTAIDFLGYRKTQWVDMCFMAEGKFFKEVGRIPEINYNWNQEPMKSSGVGSHISKLLNRKKFNLYQVKESLFTAQVEHDRSQLNNPVSQYP